MATRAIQGVGAAAVAPVAVSILSAAFGPEQRPRALGLFASITGLGTLAGPLVGGAIVQNLTWQWIFWINVPIAALLSPWFGCGSRRTRVPRAVWTISGSGW
jgi:MFS family permease